MRWVLVISNAVACLALFLVTWGLLSRYLSRVYQFDTQGAFFAVYFSLLFVMCMAVKVAETRSIWRRSLRGGVAGLLAGTAAHLVVVVLESYRFGAMSKIPLGELSLSVLMMSAALLTPLWGILAAHLAAALVKLQVRQRVESQEG